MFARRWQSLKRRLGLGSTPQMPLTLAKQHHKLDSTKISNNAIKVLTRLQQAKFDAYLVGGSVRDVLLGHQPKDFDVVTNAKPKEIRQIFRNSRLIGRRFRLVHVYFPNEIIEVSTFRTAAEEVVGEDSREMLQEDNVYGTIEEDAWRRDFTVNALYYNVTDQTVVDYTGGIDDLEQSLIRMIGDPEQRYHEDPVRLLRAIRLAARLNFKIHPETKEPLLRLPHLLCHVPSSRLFDEVMKLLFEGHAAATYDMMEKLGYIESIFPQTHRALIALNNPVYPKLIRLATEATDQRFLQKKSLNPGFLLAVILWPVMQQLFQKDYQQHQRLFTAVYHGMNEALSGQTKTLVIPRRLTAMIRMMWMLQYHLERRRRSRIFRIFSQRYFRAAFDLLQLRAEAGENLAPIVDWWQKFRDGNKEKREQLLDELT